MALLNFKKIFIIVYSSIFHILFVHSNEPLSSLMDSTASPKVKTTEREGVRARSLVRNASGVKGCVGAPRWD
jgi:hypothetical protein